MHVEHFSPWRAERHPCWHCVYFERVVVGGALCLHPRCCRLRSQPDNGCSAFEREVGADDEPGRPGASDFGDTDDTKASRSGNRQVHHSGAA